ncbi:hypothetical protein [Streptomyces albireticuli]|uniref:hypothetical protein n=1 Tax=Streptomyces albireticuli TaxID=1940 RepID=UPI003675A7FD
MERKRPPTVGKPASGPARQHAAPPPAAPRWEGSPAPRMPEPPAELGLSPVVAALPEGDVRLLASQAEAQHPDWGKEVRKELRGVPAEWVKRAIVEAAVQAGYVDVPGGETEK